MKGKGLGNGVYHGGEKVGSMGNSGHVVKFHEGNYELHKNVSPLSGMSHDSVFAEYLSKGKDSAGSDGYLSMKGKSY